MRVNAIIVTADDLGISPGVTAGILEAHRDGVVRSTSLLVTFPASQEAADFALAEIATEVRAQATRAREWGIEPLAWDSHRHTHLMPPASRVIAVVGRQEGLRYLRRARPPRLAATAKAQLLGAASFAAGILQLGIPGNDWFVDLTALPARPDPAQVALYAAYRGLGEIVAHPGRADDALRATGDTLLLRRFDDLAILTDPLLKSAFGDTIRWRVE